MMNKLIVEGLLNAIIRVGSKITSEKYILLVLSTLIRDLRNDNDVFEYMDVETTSFSSSSQKINVNPGINDVDNESLRESLSMLLERIITPSGLRGKESLKSILEYEMGPELVKSLNRLGVKIG